jgi:adenosylcobinamide-GDP ribazoletransferase
VSVEKSIPLKSWTENFFEAAGFLTIFPVPFSWRGRQPESLARSMNFFPVIGALLGLLCFWCYAILQNVLPPLAACTVLVFLPVVLSGGLHADGFGDFCDGFFGGKNKEDILRIMKDSRIGAFGALGLIFIVLMKFSLLNSLPHKLFFFPFALAAGRWSQVVLSFFLPYAGLEGGIGSATASRVTSRELIAATGFMLLISLLGGIQAVTGLFSLVPVLVGLSLFYKQKIGGVTGDLLGAASEVSEIWILAAAVWAGQGAA